MSVFKSEKVYITTPLYYVNAKPHLGHAYSTIVADVLCRFHRQRGKDVLFLTGTDEHGEKIAASAQRESRSPLAFATEVSELFQAAWKQLSLKPDIFYRTTQPSHYKLVAAALQQLKDKDEIYLASYKGKYCVGCERFRTDQEWNEQGLCPDHQTPPVEREESNYFFKMGAYQERLLDFYKKNPQSIQPSNYMSEVLSFLSVPLEDLCISRPTTRLEWGIPLPFDSNYVTYVWFDALLSYLGGLEFEAKAPVEANTAFKKDFWESSTHFIGKDILKTHAVYWPTMLMALGLKPFSLLQVGGFWLSSGLKMSKSLGNVVDPLRIQEVFGNEPFRYFLLREMSFGGDASFTWESFINRVNSELANGIGNLASRVLTLSQKNLASKVPSRQSRVAADQDFLKKIHELPAQFAGDFDSCRYHTALKLFAEGVAECDRYINENKPWSLAKDPAQTERLQAVLGTAMDALWTLSVVMAPVLPEGSAQLRRALGLASDEAPDWSKATELLKEGSTLNEVPRLYPRLELPA